MTTADLEATFLIVGGGIAGVSCAELLHQESTHLDAHDLEAVSIVLVTASPLIKAVTNIDHLTRHLASFDVSEEAAGDFQRRHDNVTVIEDTVAEVDVEAKVAVTAGGRMIAYGKLCLCHGARPKVAFAGNPYVVGIRDTQSVRDFQERLKQARRVVILGNGGIGE